MPWCLRTPLAAGSAARAQKKRLSRRRCAYKKQAGGAASAVEAGGAGCAQGGGRTLTQCAHLAPSPTRHALQRHHASTPWHPTSGPPPTNSHCQPPTCFSRSSRSRPMRASSRPFHVSNASTCGACACRGGCGAAHPSRGGRGAPHAALHCPAEAPPHPSRSATPLVLAHLVILIVSVHVLKLRAVHDNALRRCACSKGEARGRTGEEWR